MAQADLQELLNRAKATQHGPTAEAILLRAGLPEMKPTGCSHCDLGRGTRGMDRCSRCDGTGSVYLVVTPKGHLTFANTEEGICEAIVAAIQWHIEGPTQ